MDDDGRVREFVEKPAEPMHAPGDPSRALVSMGIYVFNAEQLYGYLRADAHDADSSHDFGLDVVPRLLRDGARVYAHRFADSCVNMVDGHPYWRDVGTVDAYLEANLDLARVHPELNMYDEQWPIRTRSRSTSHPPSFVFESADPRGQTLDALRLPAVAS